MVFTVDTWIALAALVIGCGWPAFQYFTKSTAKDEADEASAGMSKLLEAQRLILNDHEIRLVRLEEKMMALPGQRDHQKLMHDVGAMQGDIKVMVNAVEEIRRWQDRTEKSLGIINETLMERAG
jgi:hypothetical protein